MKNTLCCLLQNRLGAMDRLLGALTHRGFMPEHFSATMDKESDRIQVLFSFSCEDEKTLEKLIKMLHKQVYVVEIRQLFDTAERENEPIAAPFGTHNVKPIYATVPVERRA